MYKIWGTTETIYSCPSVTRHRISIKANYHCSIHYHKHKNNIFEVTSGELAVIIYEGRSYSFVLLGPGDYYNVPPMVLHSFYAMSNVSAYEIYNASIGQDVDDNDIIRLNDGGICVDLETYVRSTNYYIRQ